MTNIIERGDAKNNFAVAHQPKKGGNTHGEKRYMDHVLAEIPSRRSE